jgi:maltose alpha-D-glucosyltransferase / alpha-amylase
VSAPSTTLTTSSEAVPGVGRVPAAAPAEDALWYKDAVIYEVHVRAFLDSNDDGIGDFQGLTSKLDYIQDLGVNVIWLLPFYPSPQKDDGYDIADYHNVHPSYGTRADFRNFVREAHRRGLRVITELVVNHTSEQHPWFQAARAAPAGSPKRDYYVWSDTPDRYKGTRIIFTDTEQSNWTWDPVAKAYFWHRFFSHQPDLNFDNPHVERAIIRTMQFWLDQGVDGLRLDAVPYLIEREGTSNENLPETHQVVKRIRAALDTHYSDRMLLAEANMWPEDVRDYFADGNECHMAFHFPLMPRMYMAIAQEDRYPIVEILQQTPEIPDPCQWAIFLRNHDELTLEMVTSRERDYMYRAYAADDRARLNLGIRRRLAPLMDNDLDRIKLMNSLLLSMPGSPIIYYGDEIGMGDNFYLGDRNGVRTPMQWSPDRNAGFSRADPQRLFLPPIMDPVYGYQAVNVEAQTRDRSSLLNWMKRMLQVRKSSRAFGRGTLRFIRPGNRKVFVYLREYGEDTILCVANLARSAQPVEIDLAPYKGRVPVELLGRTTFPPIGDLPYLLTLPGYGFYWFALRGDAQPPVWHEERLQREDLPTLVLVDGWKSFFAEQLPAWRSSVAARLRGHLEERALPDFIGGQRWFAGKGSAITRAPLLDHVALDSNRGHFLVAVFQVETRHGHAPYFIPLSLVFEDTEDTQLTRLQAAAIARVRQQANVGVLADALADEVFCRRLVDAIGESAQLPTAQGAVRFTRTGAFAELRGDPGADLALSAPRAQGSNTSVRLGDNLFLKAYRHLQPGTSPELEVGRFLTDVARFPNIVPIAGAAEYYDAQGTPHAIALLQAWVQNQGDAWDYTVNYLVRFLEDRRSEAHVVEASHGLYLEFARTLGRRTAELHGALAMPGADGSFGREEIARDDLDAWRKQVRDEAERTLEQLARAEGLAGDVQELRKTLLAKRERLLERARMTVPVEMCGPKIRLHGDLHLGQVLLQRDDVVFVDFEGEPARPLAERRMKHSPLRDVAGVLRSFDYARHAALRRVPSQPGEDRARWNDLTLAWERETRDVYLRAYASSARSVGLYDSLDACHSLQTLFELEKALYELRYELENRPDWIAIPLQSLVEAVR